jgi:hypothetical protein
MNIAPHFTAVYPHLRATYEAMRELGLDESLLTFETIQPLEAHLCEPNGNLETDYCPELARLLRCIGMPFDAQPDARLPTIVIKSQGVGYDWGNGLSSGWTTMPVPPGGWRQRSTDTIDQVHMASLACSDSYWNVMPERFKTVSFLHTGLIELFRIGSVWDLPRARKYLCERVWSVMGPSLALDSRAALAMHRVMLPIDPQGAGRHLELAESIAFNLGAVYFDHGFGDSPFGSEPVLDAAWGRGIHSEGMRQSVEGANEGPDESGGLLDDELVAEILAELT